MVGLIVGVTYMEERVWRCHASPAQKRHFGCFAEKGGVAWFTLADGFMDSFNWVVRNKYQGVIDARPRLHVYCLSSHHIDYPIDCIPP